MRTNIIARGNVLMQKRIRSGLSKVDLAARAGIPHSSLLRAEQGRGVSPKTAVALSNALDMPFDELFIIERSGANGEKESVQFGHQQ